MDKEVPLGLLPPRISSPPILRQLLQRNLRRLRRNILSVDLPTFFIVTLSLEKGPTDKFALLLEEKRKATLVDGLESERSLHASA
jgi:hypothetical protein